MFPQTGHFLFKSDASLAFLTARCFRGIPLFARPGLHLFPFRDQFLEFGLVCRHLLKVRFELLSLLTLLFQLDSGAFQTFTRLRQARLQSRTVLLGFSGRLLRHHQLAAEFVSLFLQAGQFLIRVSRKAADDLSAAGS